MNLLLLDTCAGDGEANNACDNVVRRDDHVKRNPVVSKKLEIGAAAFKAQCLAILDEVHDRTRDEVVITKRGKPWAKIVPVRNGEPDVFGFLKGPFTVTGDLTEPTGEIWSAEVE